MSCTRAFLVGASASGSGKTTFTLGLLRALSRRGLRVAPFKCGPDYIDPKFHNEAVGAARSVNLDLFFEQPDELRRTFAHYTAGNDVAVVEGVMGLYDGYQGAQGSAAQLAASLGLPIILLVSAKSSAYSVAPILYGFRHFVAPEVGAAPNIVGVVFNHVASESHYQYLLSACESVGVRVLGYLPKMGDIAVPNRHLGLDVAAVENYGRQIDKIADAVEAHVDMDALLQYSVIDIPPAPDSARPASTPLSLPLRIGVACDEAFNFTYRANMDHLRAWGDVSFFSPIHDDRLDTYDLIYLAGGYPEFYLPELSANRSMHEAIRCHAKRGGKIFAECGGMMYLCKAIIGMDGLTYPMLGLLDQTATMEGMRLRLGYRQFEYNGQKWRGHEFHYSTVVDPLASVTEIYTARGEKSNAALWRVENIVASYVHLYWGNNNLLGLFDYV